MQNPDYATAERRARGQIFGVSGEAKVLRTLHAKSNATRRMGAHGRRLRDEAAKARRDHGRNYAERWED